MVKKERAMIQGQNELCGPGTLKAGGASESPEEDQKGEVCSVSPHIHCAVHWMWELGICTLKESPRDAKAENPGNWSLEIRDGK